MESSDAAGFYATARPAEGRMPRVLGYPMTRSRYSDASYMT